jgi:16S rRNA (guanine966-N2)-methyltransferase
VAQKNNKNSLRIIGGTWRSRRIQFLDNPDIRPTPDRVRETLFNWLAKKIDGASCLDLFAGSGALGFEAASRGASQVIQVDVDAATTEMLVTQKQVLDAQQIHIVQQDALAFLQQTEQAFDIIFLDPPFNTELLNQALSALIARKLVAPEGLIYMESAAQFIVPQCLDELTCRREKVAGQVRYALFEMPN